MYAMNRTNKFGVQYHIMQLSDKQTEIRTEKAKIIIDHNIHTISQGWYDWTMKGQQVQEAFKFLSDDEREFLLTGLTKEQWDKLFAEEEN